MQRVQAGRRRIGGQRAQGVLGMRGAGHDLIARREGGHAVTGRLDGPGGGVPHGIRDHRPLHHVPPPQLRAAADQADTVRTSTSSGPGSGTGTCSRKTLPTPSPLAARHIIAAISSIGLGSVVVPYT